MVTERNNHTVHTFIEIFQKEFSALKPRTTNNRDNLTKEERMALKNIKERNDIIITHADKGGALVIIHILDYLKKQTAN